MLASLNVGTSYTDEYAQNQRLILSPASSGTFYCGPSCEFLISIGKKLPVQVPVKRRVCRVMNYLL